MQPHQQRVVDEKLELDSKISKLVLFTETPIFKEMEQIDQSMLTDQLYFMDRYSQVLGQRIDNFK